MQFIIILILILIIFSIIKIFPIIGIILIITVVGIISYLIYINYKEKKKNFQYDYDQPIIYNNIHNIQKRIELMQNDAQDTINKTNIPVENPNENILIPARIDGIPLAYHYEDVNIAVIHTELPDFNKFNERDKANLLQEKTNPYDENAVSVNVGDIKIGYLYRGTLQDIANDFIDSELPILSYITDINKEKHKVQIFLGFYRNSLDEYTKLKNRGDKYKTIRLSGNTNAEMQENISLCSVGDEVDFDYDYEKEKYIASSDCDIGYVPISKSDFLDNEEDYKAFIESIEENDNGKYVVRVSIFQ